MGTNHSGNNEHPDFMKTVKEIRDAEEGYERQVGSAREKADRIIREAKETAMGERRKAEESTLSLKNKRLQDGSKDIEKEVEKILSKAKDEADRTRKKGLDKPAIEKMAKEFISSL